MSAYDNAHISWEGGRKCAITARTRYIMAYMYISQRLFGL